MSLDEHWSALAARIDGVSRAAELHSRFLAVNTSDPYGVSKEIGRQCGRILDELQDLSAMHVGALSSEVRLCIKGFLTNRTQLILQAPNNPGAAWASVTFLVALKSELDHLIFDRQAIIRSKTERAFAHLQRVLFVDDSERSKWLSALKESGEVGCERRGAIHLLWHGIYAFKVSAEGARTDLVFAEPIEAPSIRYGLEGLVLTEWKVATDKNAAKRFEEARQQAQLYAAGPLAGLELAQYRYLVAVSPKDLPSASIPDDVDDGGITFRHINIAIEPDVPSRAARKGG